MTCRRVQNSLSAHFDGVLSLEERRDIVQHLEQCRPCQTHFEQLKRVKNAVHRLPARQAPAQLATALRVIASKQRQRAISKHRWFDGPLDQFRLWGDNLMRPLALPFAGGLVSAVLLFSMLVPSFALRRVTGADIPVNIITEPSIKAQMPFADFDSDVDVTVEVVVDSQGRMVDYTVPKGSDLSANPELRRAIEKKLLFTEFTPATMWGQPTVGKVFVSFQRRSIDIKS